MLGEYLGKGRILTGLADGVISPYRFIKNTAAAIGAVNVAAIAASTLAGGTPIGISCEAAILNDPVSYVRNGLDVPLEVDATTAIPRVTCSPTMRSGAA